MKELNWKLIGLIGIILLFGLLVWPGMWSLAIIQSSNGQALLRVNKLTGGTRLIATTIPQQAAAAQSASPPPTAPMTIPAPSK